MTHNWAAYCKSFIPSIKKRHFDLTGRQCNLEQPTRFTDKLEWLKVYDSTYLKNMCSDKLAVRSYVQHMIGKDISIPVLKTYKNFDSIKFNELPRNYVLKTNHGSHTNIIVTNNNIDIPHARSQFNNWMSKDWSWYGYEFCYTLIPRKIFAETYMNDGHSDLVDYKFLCFNGTPMYCQVIADRRNNQKHLNYYDMNWIEQPRISRTDFPSNYSIKHEKPKTFEIMKDYATTLSKPFKFVRVDLYDIHGTVYFGELTFYPGAAYITYTNDDIDYMFGSMLKL